MAFPISVVHVLGIHLSVLFLGCFQILLRDRSKFKICKEAISSLLLYGCSGIRIMVQEAEVI